MERRLNDSYAFACDQCEKVKTTKQTILAMGGSIITTLLGEWNIALEVLLIFIVIDYITGVVAAAKNKALCSSIGFDGLMKKAAIFLVLILAAQLDRIAGTAGFFRSSTAFFFVANEGLSILENIEELGIRYPTFIKDHLKKLRDTKDNSESANPTHKDEQEQSKRRKG